MAKLARENMKRCNRLKKQKHLESKYIAFLALLSLPACQEGGSWNGHSGRGLGPDFPSATYLFSNEKVLLRERKRHTDRRVASTRYAVLVGGGGGVPTLGGGVPTLGRGVPTLGGGYLPWGGTYPGWGVPTLGGGYLPWVGGYLPWVGGYLPWLGGTYPGRGVPTLGGGYLPWVGGTYPGWGVPT